MRVPYFASVRRSPAPARLRWKAGVELAFWSWRAPAHLRLLCWLGLALLSGVPLACGPRLTRSRTAAEYTQRYVVTHRSTLEREIGTGSGPSILGLSRAGGCQEPAQLGRVLHKHQDDIFSQPPPTSELVAERILDLIAKYPELRCVDLEDSRGRVVGPGRNQSLPGRTPWGGNPWRNVPQRPFPVPDR